MRYAIRSIVLMFIGIFLTLPAHAADFRPYAGGGVGGFLIDAGLGSKDAFGGYVSLGVDLSDYYGVELRLGGTGKTLGNIVVPQLAPDGPVLLVPTPAKVSIDWFTSYLLKLQYPLSDQTRIYGVIGATTLKSSFLYAGHTGHSTKTTLSYGGGFDYGLGNQWRVGVDATVYSNEANTNPGANFTGVDVWGLTGTAKYEF